MINQDIQRNLGEQPVAELMKKHNLKPHDLVLSCTKQLTHKMVSRACKGRRLTVNSQKQVLDALNNATGCSYSISDLFTY